MRLIHHTELRNGIEAWGFLEEEGDSQEHKSQMLVNQISTLPSR